MSSSSRIIRTLRELLENMFLVLTTAAATACFTWYYSSVKFTSILVQYFIKYIEEEGLLRRSIILRVLDWKNVSGLYFFFLLQ